MKKYTEKEIWNVIKKLSWSSTICDHEPCYGQMTIQVALGTDEDYIGEFIQDIEGLYDFVFNL